MLKRIRIRRDATGPSEGGFTLVEMVIAISVLAVVMLSAGGMLNSGLRGLAAAKARARGNEITTQGIEDLQRFSFNNMGLCAAATGTAPSGLDDTVFLANCPVAPATPAYEDPCHPATAGTVPRAEYTCTVNNITYAVKRYVAWADALKQTKRLAVYVEWTDLAGRHQVSQQSSLRAPDQAAITGLAPPTFSSPAPAAQTTTLTADATGHLTADVNLTAKTSNLNKSGTTTLVGAIPTHTPDEHINITVGSSTAFPTYNGYPVTIGTESFTVVAGAGTTTWTVRTTGSSAVPSGTAVVYPGDQVYATFLTLGPNGSPQQSTELLTTADGVNWNGVISAADFTFGFGTQYVSFGILRAADGKTTSAFATTPLTVCPVSGCTGQPLPSIPSWTVPSTVSIGSSGELTADVVVQATTINVTSADSVTVSFLTQSGSVTVQLSHDPTTTACPGIADATIGVECHWTGTIPRSAGYRFSSGPQQFYFGAAQIEDHDPATIDHGSTGVLGSPGSPATPPTVTFS